jgi:hypothetical protein
MIFFFVKSAKTELNIPCLKSFVDTLYPVAIDLSTKNKHRQALFPLVTCLLCVSHKQYFLNNWQTFVTLCLQNLRSRDLNHTQISLESIYCLIWVYMIRIKGEKINDTNHRLQGIINSLFPKGTKLVVPKEMPVNIFVRIIHFIAYEKLDFAMREIIYDLLLIGKTANKDLMPLRMDIGLRAFLLIADSLQNKEGPPPMPLIFPSSSSNLTNQSSTLPPTQSSTLPIPVVTALSTLSTQSSLQTSSSTKLLKRNTTALAASVPVIISTVAPTTVPLTSTNKALTESVAKEIGLYTYYEDIRRGFQDILKILDNSIGRTFLMTRPDSANTKDVILNADNKSKLCLLRTCVSAIPRLIPNIKENDLIDILARYTIHYDDELKLLSFQSLQAFVLDFPSWRKYVFMGFCNFILKEVNDLYPNLLENAFKMLIQFINTWKLSLMNTKVKNKFHRKSF